jgi:hypothetical protein
MSQDYSIHCSPSMPTNEDIRGGCYTESMPEPLQQDPLDVSCLLRTIFLIALTPVVRQFSWLPAMSQGYTMNYSGNTLTSGNVHRGYDPASMPELLQQDSLDVRRFLPSTISLITLTNFRQCFGLPSMSQEHSIDYSGNMLNNENNHRQHETVSRPDPLQQGSLHVSLFITDRQSY